ncbi:hypothetical protein L0U88_06055 [Flavihumibacter sp. RY-1]|uniref:Uncharacterized protein n=1 Tax=Flavihumibacter fluminis TaxID=2909236 RepID=A0ABS9BF14_9BACT|nr:hypothetical protein [Flavihumibacter fluminis]MCF1714185.1 hypothetical protein [Flavihumibacter fluminis]
MENKSEIQDVTGLIVNEFRFLEDLGYSSFINYPVDENFLEYVKVEYKNLQKNRNVSISYTKGKVFDDIKRSFQLCIVKLPYQDPRTDFFSQSIFMESLGKGLKASMVNEFSKEKAQLIIGEISKSLRTYSLDIIKGEAWEEGYYPRWN